jgi:hypothetical protein
MIIEKATEPPKWLTRKEAAGYLRLGESTLAKLFVSGDGPPAIKVGRAKVSIAIYRAKYFCRRGG